MKNIFTRLRQPVEQSQFSDQLFSSRWWLLEKPTSKRNEVIRGEKEQTLKSLNHFVEQKQKDGKDFLRFPGGEILSKPSVPTIEIESQVTTLDHFYQLLDGCNRCSQKLGSPQYQKSSPGIEILIVCDFPGNSKEKVQLLDRMIGAMKLAPDQYVKSLAIKCSSDGDMEDEWELMGNNCREHLHKEISLLKPRVVLTFGAVATRLLLNEDVKLSKVHGKFHPQKIECVGEKSFDFQLVPIFHLDLLMINPNMKKITWKDLQSVMKFLGKL